jgi:hypothetical protein
MELPLSETFLNITGMRAEFTMAVAIAFKICAAMQAGEAVYGALLNLVTMRIPPSAAARIGAKAPGLPLRSLGQQFATVPT